MPVRGDPSRNGLAEDVRESLQDGGVGGKVARCSLELPCLVGRDAPDHLQTCSGGDERGEPVDTDAALLERRVRAARLGVDLPADRSCAGRSPSGGEIEVGVDHDQPVGSKLGVVRGERCDAEAGVRDADEQEFAADTIVECACLARERMQVGGVAPVEVPVRAETEADVPVLREATAEQRQLAAPRERANLLAVRPASGRDQYALRMRLLDDRQDRRAGRVRPLLIRRSRGQLGRGAREGERQHQRRSCDPQAPRPPGLAPSAAHAIPLHRRSWATPAG